MKIKPVIFKEGEYDESELDRLKKGKVWRFEDIYESQLIEFFEISNPSLFKSSDGKLKLKNYLDEKSTPKAELRGNYVYYPWSGLLLHMVSESELRTLRTNRTNNLLTREEQKQFADFTAGIAGLSFGNGIALSIVYGGASDKIKIADSDVFETTNLNRVRTGLPSVNRPKTDITAQEIYEINPYADVRIFEKGLNGLNIQDFVNGEPKLNIIFDVVDDFSIKVKLRLAAKEAQVPVVMLTSLEDSVLVDVERFDLDPSAEIFHGLLGPTAEEMLTKEMTEEEKAQYAIKIVGPGHVSYRNLWSLSEIGKTLVSRPHLNSTVNMVCGLAGYIAKRIAMGEEMPSIRKHVQFHEILGTSPNKDDTRESRAQVMRKLLERS